MTARLTELFPLSARERALSGTYLAHRLHTLGSVERPLVYANFVSSLDGRIARYDPASGEYRLPERLTSANDFRLFLELHAQADCLITHGGYLRALAAGQLGNILQCGHHEQAHDLSAWRKTQGLEAQPAVVVASASLDFPLPTSVVQRNQPLHIATGARAAPQQVQKLRDQGHHVIVAGAGDRVEGGPLAEALGGLGYRSLYLIAGPRMLETMLRDRQLDRLYLTMTHRLLGGERYRSLLSGPELDEGALALQTLFYDPGSRGTAGQWFAQFRPCYT